MQERRRRSGSPEQRENDPFQAAINQYNTILYTRPEFNSNDVRKALLDVQAIAFQSTAITPDKIFDRLHVLASQAAMIAREKQDASAEDFSKLADSYKTALDNFIGPSVRSTGGQPTPSDLPPMTGGKGV